MTAHTPGPWHLVCPNDATHTLSADREPDSYYCYTCGEHWILLRQTGKKDQDAERRNKS